VGDWTTIWPTVDRSHVHGDGTPKACLTEAEARATAERFPSTRAYQCRVCPFWHCGRPRRGGRPDNPKDGGGQDGDAALP